MSIRSPARAKGFAQRVRPSRARLGPPLGADQRHEQDAAEVLPRVRVLAGAGDAHEAHPYVVVGILERNGSVLGYNYPGDAWYTDGYKLLTSNNLRPSIEPKSPGAKRSYLQRLIQNKDETLPPPGEEPRR